MEYYWFPVAYFALNTKLNFNLQISSTFEENTEAHAGYWLLRVTVGTNC